MKQKKYLGQHFLKNRKILEEMARAAGLTKKPARNATHSVAGGDVVLEVGPGTGTLTEVLAERTRRVIAVEKDRDLIPALREKFRNKKNVEIVEGDVLKIFNSQFSISNQFKNLEIENSLKIRNCKLKIVANLPYYITSRFLRLFLSQTRFRPRIMVLMIQREVAERICARDGKESLLSLSVKAYSKPEIVRMVPRGAFSPPPKVDSAIIKISNISDKFFKKHRLNEKKFFDILRAAFQKKRKMLRHSLKHTAWNPEHDSSSMLQDPRFNRRPEELSLKDWVKLLNNSG